MNPKGKEIVLSLAFKCMCHLANCQARIHKYSSQEIYYLISAMENKWVGL